MRSRLSHPRRNLARTVAEGKQHGFTDESREAWGMMGRLAKMNTAETQTIVLTKCYRVMDIKGRQAKSDTNYNNNG